MLLVRFHGHLPHGEVLQRMEDGFPQFRAVPGLVQRFYARDAETGENLGVYLFDSEEALAQYRESALASSVPGVYRVEGTSRPQVLEVQFPANIAA